VSISDQVSLSLSLCESFAALLLKAEPKKKDYALVLWVLWVFTKKASEEAF